ncbi:MAG: nucleoside monophosphate kinase [bacterium]|nr:nucleoside monophosphate kinase [bacterium]
MSKNKQYNIIILGPQGSGKGSQAILLTEKFNLVHIETGKIFRQMAATNTPLGKKINYIINNKGVLVNDELVLKVLEKGVVSVNKKKGLLFDGFPRTLNQARGLDKLFKKLDRELTHVIYMPIKKSTTIKRLSKRRTCENCGKIFISGVNIKSNQKECPVCRGKIIQREDDKPKAIAKRLEIYRKSTKPIIIFYKKKGIVIKVDGEPTIKQVFKEILKVLK